MQDRAGQAVQVDSAGSRPKAVHPNAVRVTREWCIGAEVERLRAEGVRFRSDIVTGPGGKQIVLDDPAGNPLELFQPAGG